MATFNGTTANDTLIGSGLSDYLAGLGGNDSLSGDFGVDTLDGGTGSDTLDGGYGDDTYIVDSANDVIADRGGLADRIQASISIDLNSTAYADIEHVTLTGTGALNATGNSDDNMLIGNSGANTLDGRAGADTMLGAAGDDAYTVDDSSDSIVEVSGEGTDQVNSSAASFAGFVLPDFVENLTLTGTADINGTGNALGNKITGNSGANGLSGGDGNDTLTSNDDDDFLDGGGGADSMVGGTGNDEYFVDDAGDTISESGPSTDVDTVDSAISYVLGSTLENLNLFGSNSLTGTGNALANVINGNLEDSILFGLGGDDTLDGSEGDDLLLGGDGNDWLVNHDGRDTLVGGAGNDVFELTRAIHFAPAGPTSGTIADFNGLAGGDVIDITDFLEGSGVMPGTAGKFLHTVSDNGSTTLQIDVTGTKNFVDLVVLQGVSTNLDGLLANASILGIGTLTATTLVGTSAADTLTAGATSQLVEGLDGNDSLSGGKGFDTLDGGTGSDTLAGGKGSDTYIVDSALDVITDTGGADDRIQASISIDLNSTAYDGIEHVTLTGTSGLGATGDEFANMLIGNGGANALDGRAGADTMIGGASNDTYTVDDGSDSIVEFDGEGTDQVNSSASLFVLADYVESLTLTGTADIDGTGNALGNAIVGNTGSNELNGRRGDDTLTGNDGRDTLDGGNGADSMIGGAGEDRYIVDDPGDSVSETGPSTVEADTVVASLSYVLGTTLENLILDGPDAIDGTGNSLNNVITGSTNDNVLSGLAGNDLLDGLTGNDLLLGGDGNDLLQITSAGADTLVGGAGSDIFEFDAAVFSTIADFNGLPGGDFIDLQQLLPGGVPSSTAGSFLLTRTVAGSTILSFDADGPGGNSPVDIAELRGVSTDLAGLLANGTIIGAIGGSSPPVAGTSGADTLAAAATSTLVEGLGGNDSLSGGKGFDTLDGGTGGDTLAGGKGGDTYIIDSTLDVITDTGGANDRIQATISIDLNSTAYAGIEHVTLTGTGALNATGNSGDNLLIGNDGANILDGQGGGDQLAGGRGDDTYIVDSFDDVVFENPGEGTDQVNASTPYGLAANIENLTIIGTDDAGGEGNDLANKITGNSGVNRLEGLDGNDTLTGNEGDDVLDGGLGADSMSGGIGDDGYIVDSSGDEVVESANGGTDEVVSTITYTLGSDLENLTLASSLSPIDGTGNSLNNVIGAVIGDNVLSGLAGNDTLDGGQGNDLLLGGDGADLLQAAEGADTLAGGAGSDRFIFNATSLDGVDVISDFSNAPGGDVLDVSDLLTGFNATTSNINDFLQTVESNGSTTIRVDTDGGGNSFVDMAVLEGVNTDISGLLNNGSLVLPD